jgi:hypothetical protein
MFRWPKAIKTVVGIWQGKAVSEAASSKDEEKPQGFFP